MCIPMPDDHSVADGAGTTGSLHIPGSKCQIPERTAGHVKTLQQLMQESKMVVDDSTITSHIKRIRKKFIDIDSDFDCIDTVYGMGYRWNVDE